MHIHGLNPLERTCNAPSEVGNKTSNQEVIARTIPPRRETTNFFLIMVFASLKSNKSYVYHNHCSCTVNIIGLGLTSLLRKGNHGTSVIMIHVAIAE